MNLLVIVWFLSFCFAIDRKAHVSKKGVKKMFVHIQEVTKNYGSLTVFEKLSMKIPANHKIGLVGDNGSGKSSLFKLIVGIEEPNSGTITRKKGLRIGYLEQLPKILNGVTVKEVIEKTFFDVLQLEQQLQQLEKELTQSPDEMLLGKYGRIQEQFIQQGGYDIEHQIEKMTTGLGIQHLLAHPFNQLSGGEQTKVGLAKVLLEKPELLLLDEPTNHLDLGAIEWLEGYLNEYQGTIVTISHDRRFLDEVVTEIYELEDEQIQVYQGNYSSYVVAKKVRLEKEHLNYQEQQKKIKKLETAIRRYRQWGNESGNEDMFKKAKSLEKRLARMEQVKRPILEKEKIQLRLDVHKRSGKKVVIIEQVTKKYGEKVLFEDLDFSLYWSKHIGVVGENGVGKSTLIQLILQNIQPDSGYVKLGEQVKIGYLPQKVEFTNEALSILATFREAIPMDEGEARHFLAQFLFYREDVFRSVKQLSGGERIRLKLAILMKSETNFLILDEPTNHLDISTREVMEDVLGTYQGTLLAVSHDRYFLDKLFNEILWITPKKVTLYPGSFQWARKKQRSILTEEPTLQASSTKQAKETTKNKQQQMIGKIEQELERVTAKLAEIQEELTQTTDFMELADLVKKQEELANEVNQLETSWLELME